jgi:hypothetical protein
MCLKQFYLGCLAHASCLIGAEGRAAVIDPQRDVDQYIDAARENGLEIEDDVEGYPAHGAGSLCGRNMSRETMSTMGEQRKLNHALQPMARDAFIAMMMTDLPDVPAYFATDART